MRLARSTHVTVQDRITEGLREQILSGKVRPGERLRQTEIAKLFNASHIPVREALRRLDAEGLVSIESHRGAVVTVLSRAELEEVIRLRQVLEVELLRRAIPRMTPDDIAQARKALSALRSNRSLVSYATRNWAFHETLYRPAEAPLTLTLVERLHRVGERYFELRHNLGVVNAEHRAIMDLAAKGEARRATNLLHRHIGQLIDRVSIPKHAPAPH